MPVILVNILVAILPTFVSSFLGLNKDPSTARNDDINLGKAENELDHVRRENADRAALEAIPPATATDTASSLRNGQF